MAEATASEGANSLHALQGDLEGEVGAALDALGERLDTAFTAAQHRLEVLSNASTRLADQFVEAAEKFVTSIHQTQTHAEDAFNSLSAVQQAVSEQLEQFDDQRQADVATLHAAHVSMTSTNQEMERSSRQHNDELISQVESLVDQMQLAAEYAQHLADSTKASLVAFGDNAEQHIQDLRSALDTLATHAERILAELESAVESASATAEQALSGGLTDALQSIQAGAADATGALRQLCDFADALAGDYRSEIEEVMGIITQVVDLIETIRPVLELAEQLT